MEKTRKAMNYKLKEMKTREEIEAIALELYPESPNFFGMDTNKTRRDGFIKGYELCQQDIKKNEKG